MGIATDAAAVFVDNVSVNKAEVRALFATIIETPLHAFAAQLRTAATNVTGPSATPYPIVFDGVEYNDGGGFEDGIFTCLVAGRYHFELAVTLSGILSAHTEGQVQLVRSGGTIFVGAICNPYGLLASGQVELAMSRDISLTVGQTITPKVLVMNGTQVVDIDITVSRFSGHLLAA